MKKTLALLTALMMMLTVLPGLGEESTEAAETIPEIVSPVGDWYADLHGVTMKLTFREDGSYRQSVPGRDEESAEGVWETIGGMIYLDGDENVALACTETGLRVGVSGLRFTREEPEGYVPGAVAAGDQTDLTEFQGAWSSAWVMAGGRAIPAEDLGDDTILYIEGSRAALTGDLFGEMIVEMTYADGALTLADETGSVSLTLQMQLDHQARMTVRAGETELVYILGAYMTEGLLDT